MSEGRLARLLKDNLHQSGSENGFACKASKALCQLQCAGVRLVILATLHSVSAFCRQSRTKTHEVLHAALGRERRLRVGIHGRETQQAALVEAAVGRVQLQNPPHANHPHNGCPRRASFAPLKFHTGQRQQLKHKATGHGRSTLRRSCQSCPQNPPLHATLAAMSKR